MRHCGTRWIYSLPVFLALSWTHQGAHGQEQTSLIDFYDMPFGTVGINIKHIRDSPILNQSSQKDAIQILKDSKANILPTRTHYCLMINHRLNESHSSSERKTYFAIRLVFNDTQDVRPVHLYRSNGWITRATGYPAYSGKAVPTQVGLEEFNNLHTIRQDFNPSISYMDSRLRLQWHGQPYGSSSSTLRSLFFFKSESRFETPQPRKGYPLPYSSEEFLRVTSMKTNPLFATFNLNRPDFKQTLTGVLLSYTPAPQGESSKNLVTAKNKVVYCFERHNAVSAHLKILSPLGDNDFNSWFTLVFDKNSRLIKINPEIAN